MNVIRFYKKHNAWYADVAEHTEAENRMVAGADTFLEKIDEKKLVVSTGSTTVR